MDKEMFIIIIAALGFGELVLAFVAAALVHKLIETRNRMDDLIGLAELAIQDILSQHKEILKTWNSIETRYSDAYEQFRHCSDELTELNKKVNQPFYTGADETELGDAS